MQIAATHRTFQVLLVDDSPSFLESALRFLSSDERIEIVGLALTGREALQQIEILQPDLVLMDWQMPDMNGLEATRQIKATRHAPRVIILTLHECDEYRDAAFCACADGFVAKSNFGLDLLPLIEQVLSVPAARCDDAASLAITALFDQRARPEFPSGFPHWETTRGGAGYLSAATRRPLFSAGLPWKN